MSLRFEHIAVGALLAALAVGGPWLPSVHAQGLQHSKREISASETNTAEIFHSLKQLGGKEDGLRQLEQELNKSAGPFASRHSFEPSMPLSSGPIPTPAVQTRRNKDDWDGWLLNADGFMPGSGADEAMDFPGLASESKDKQKASWEQLYQKLKQDSPDASSFGPANKKLSRQLVAPEDDRDLPSGIRDHAQILRKSLESSDFGGSIFKTTTNPKSSFSDFFGVGDNGMSPDQVKAHKAYMDQYVTTVFGNPTPAADPNSLNTFASTPAVQAPASTSLDTLPSVARPDRATIASGPNSLLNPPSLPDLNNKVLNQWNPMYTEPKLELPKPAPFFTPPIEAPRRRFF